MASSGRLASRAISRVSTCSSPRLISSTGSHARQATDGARKAITESFSTHSRRGVPAAVPLELVCQPFLPRLGVSRAPATVASLACSPTRDCQEGTGQLTRRNNDRERRANDMKDSQPEGQEAWAASMTERAELREDDEVLLGREAAPLPATRGSARTEVAEDAVQRAKRVSLAVTARLEGSTVRTSPRRPGTAGRA